MAETSIFSGADDAQLQALYAQLSAGASEGEIAGAIGGGDAPGFTPYNKLWSKGARANMTSSDHSAKAERERIGQGSLSAAAYQGYKNSKRKKKELKKSREFNKANVAARQQYMAQRTERMEQVKQELHRRQLKGRINGYFNSEGMQGLYDNLQNRHLENSLSQITQQYGDQLRQQSFQTAGQGLVGSSVDATRRGDVQQGQNAAAIQAQGQAQQFAQGARNQNEQQRQGLVNTAMSGNPYDGAAFDQQLQGISNQTQQMGQQYAATTAQNQINQNGMNMQSQAMGGLLSAYGNLYQSNQQTQAYDAGTQMYQNATPPRTY